jgi:hypothetical protein
VAAEARSVAVAVGRQSGLVGLDRATFFRQDHQRKCQVVTNLFVCVNILKNVKNLVFLKADH